MFKKLIKDIFISTLVLIVVNLIGQYVNFHIPINIFTILLLGIFKLPGFVIILLILII